MVILNEDSLLCDEPNEKLCSGRAWPLPREYQRPRLDTDVYEVIVAGAGGLGFPVLQYLGAAGLGLPLYIQTKTALTRCTGRIGIVNPGKVEVSNLQRQILHIESRVGWYKAESAAQAPFESMDCD